MMMMMEKLQRLGRRQIHTIISRESIKPSSPTPSHLQTYNLSDLDLLNPKAYIPLLLFYPNNPNSPLTPHQKATLLKKSLSHTLTPHYPFAGTLHTTPSYIHCNDAGVLFTEATNHNRLQAFKQMTGQDEALGQLFPDGVVHHMPPGITNVARVQLNHFCCGGLGIAISMSHLIGDACSLGTFLSHWASVARYGSIDHIQVRPMTPHFINLSRINHVHHESREIRDPPVCDHMDQLFVARKFVFPNSKLTDLKNKVGLVNNPTRVEVLTSLLYTTAVAAAAAKSGGFKPSYLFFMVNMRDKFVNKLPQTTIGNFVLLMMVPTNDLRESSLGTVVAEIKKQKLQLEGIQSVQQVVEMVKSLQSKMGNKELENVGDGSYYCSSFCGFPFSKLDFGWGKPMGTTLATKTRGKNGFVLMDTPGGDGIEALVMLEEQHMKIFENDKEMLSFCHTGSL